MAKFQMGPTIGTVAETARMGTKVAPLTDADVGKALKLVGPSQLDLAAADDEIFGFLSSIEPGTLDGFTIGGFVTSDYREVDTGAVAAGTPVVVSSNPAKGSSGKTVVKAGAAGAPLTYKWVVVHPGVVKRV